MNKKAILHEKCYLNTIKRTDVSSYLQISPAAGLVLLQTLVDDRLKLDDPGVLPKIVLGLAQEDVRSPVARLDHYLLRLLQRRQHFDLQNKFSLYVTFFDLKRFI